MIPSTWTVTWHGNPIWVVSGDQILFVLLVVSFLTGYLLTQLASKKWGKQ